MTPALFRFHALRLAQHSARWREHQAASDSDVLVIRFEDLKRDCDNQLKRLLHWLGVSVDATVASCACRPDRSTEREPSARWFNFTQEMWEYATQKLQTHAEFLGYDLSQPKGMLNPSLQLGLDGWSDGG